MANAARTSVEFVVKPKEDLYLDGSLRRLPRVTKGEPYPCQMQKNQNFSCLFRHYAKHNGLRKEDLIFTFVEELQPDQTPETVHLMPQDEIFVEHRKSESEVKPLPMENNYSQDFYKLLETGMHSDIKFILDLGDTTLLAHKAILSARSEYFEAMFRVGGMSESSRSEMKINHDASSFRRMLEFIYTNDVKDIDICSPNEAIELLVMANEYLLEDLRQLCETRVVTMITTDNIGKLLLLSAGHNASALRDACAEFVQENKVALASDPQFRKEIESNADLGLLLFETSVPKGVVNLVASIGANDSNDSLLGKRRRRSGENVDNSDLDLNPPQLHATSTSGSNAIQVGNITYTIAQPNFNVQDN